MFVCLNGKFVDEFDAVISVKDHGFLFGDGVYDTLRTFDGKLFFPERHLDRLYAALGFVNINVPWLKGDVMNWVNEGIKKNNFSETRIRITVTRGVNKFKIINVVSPTLLISFSDISDAPVVYDRGVTVITCEAERTLPSVKTISMAPVMAARAVMEKAGAFEVLLVNRKGKVTEGSVTNLFVVKDGVVKTPGDDVLEGITRGLVLKWLDELGMKFMVCDLTLDDLYNADEVFVTNAIRGVVPVAEVDGRVIGDGEVGEVCTILMGKWRGKLEK